MRFPPPMKLVDGKYQKISWEQAIRVGDALLALKKQSGRRRVLAGVEAQQRAGVPDAQVRVVLGTNNCDHQARICHSTTVAGVANTWATAR
jgi:formate dehydrogenase major subunit